jgi:1-acyl-sn-glycerol-3-phosphate acyltransferase
MMTMKPGDPLHSTAPSRYEFPRPELAWLGVHLLFGWRRSLLRDCQTFLRTNPYPRRVEGIDHVPAAPPFVIVANHYGRPGLKPYHSGMVVTGLLAQARPALPHIRWVITSEWFGRRLGPVPIPPSLYRWTFRRAAKVYRAAIMPRRAGEVMARAAVLRDILRSLQRECVGLMPEAGGSGTLRQPLEGSGLFVHSLVRRGVPVIPVGLWDDGDTLVVSFGPPLALAPAGEDRLEQDRSASEQMMVAIGRLLPERQWGIYREAIRRSLAGSGGI